MFNPGRTATAPTTRVVVRPPATAPTTVAANVPLNPPPATSPDAMPAPTTPDGTGLSSGTDAAASSDTPAPQDAADAAAQSTDDPAWKGVLAARQLKDEGKAIVLFDDYARTHPDTHADRIQAFTETMLDRIWFERIDGLCNQREELGKKIADLDKEIAEETDQNYKKKVAAPLRARYAEQLNHIEDELTSNMKYAAKVGPNLLDNAEMDKLRQARDPQYYALWKARILEHVRRTHGELPWVTNKSL
jgi:hypothetical protein